MIALVFCKAAADFDVALQAFESARAQAEVVTGRAFGGAFE